MKTQTYRIILIVSILLIIVTAFIGILVLTKSDAPPQTNSVSASDSEYMYLVKEYKGKVAVFKTDGTTPYLTLDVYANNLPDKDRAELSGGIKIQTEEQLTQLIEDLES